MSDKLDKVSNKLDTISKDTQHFRHFKEKIFNILTPTILTTKRKSKKKIAKRKIKVDPWKLIESMGDVNPERVQSFLDNF